MDVYEAIAKRMTIRDFDEREIPLEIIKKLLSAGLQAPTNDHLRRWEFILVQDRTQREVLIHRLDKPRSPQSVRKILDGWGLIEPIQREMYMEGIPKQHSMLLNAGALIIPCFYTETPLLKPETLSSLNSFASIWCCIENILVAAASEGIFGVTRIPFEAERKTIRRLLKIPALYETPCYLALGYPAQGENRSKQCEVNLEEKIHFNRW
ncbi:MAG: nitroreductase [Chloroflexi bacterium]|nr:nitroreductase [Chloroflexota bacterium]